MTNSLFSKSQRLAGALVSGMLVASAGLVMAATNDEKQATRTPFSEIEWTENKDLGVELFGAFGDSSKGPHITYVKFKAGLTRRAPFCQSER